jgi:hypothetical protein
LVPPQGGGRRGNLGSPTRKLIDFFYYVTCLITFISYINKTTALLSRKILYKLQYKMATTTSTQRFECVVCTESATKISCCPFCDYSTCRSCAQTYILGEPTPKCMNCRNTWSREIQIRELTATFVNGPLKKHAENVLFEGQRALLPATLEIYEREHKLKMAAKASREAGTKLRLYKESVDYYTLDTKLRRLRVQLFGVSQPHKYGSPEHKAELESSGYNTCLATIREIESNPVFKELDTDHENKLKAHQQLQYLDAIRRRNERQNTQTNNVKAEPRFIRACPAENCRGFLSSKWKCGLCDLSTCPDCLVVKEPDQQNDSHICNPDDVLSAKMMAKDSKPCPKCAAGIFKIDGCDQMWCTMCHTAFSWNTGEIETKDIHNPHFFEYQRKQNAIIPRAIGDIPCGRELDNQTLQYMRHVMTIKNIDESLMLRIHDITRAASHLQMVVVREYRTDRVADFLDLRIKYISSQIDEPEFRSRLVRDMKKHDKNREIGEVIQMLMITLHELLFRFFHEIENLATAEIYQNLHTLDEIDRLYEYVNECLRKICRVYGTTLIGVRIMDPETFDEPVHGGTGIYTIKNKKA